MKKGALLLNLGTPKSPKVPDVRNYLREFLMDPYVIDIPYILRWILVHILILPFRPKKSAHAYEKIWTKRGSPLMFHSEDLLEKVRIDITQPMPVELAMRYGTPSIVDGLKQLKDQGVEKFVIFPLYPQYSFAASETAIEAVENAAERLQISSDHLHFVEAFFNDEGFLNAFAENINAVKETFNPDYFLFSFHGVPERQVSKTEITPGFCKFNDACCAQITDGNRNCYRAQSFATAKALAKKLNLNENNWSISFQSRLGRTQWLTPYTDFVIPELAKKGVKRIAVISPAFVADCLETLEELAIRAREDFKAHGGEELILVPSLNSNDSWVKAVTNILERN